VQGFYEYVRDIWLSPWSTRLLYAIFAAGAFEVVYLLTSAWIRRRVTPALRRDAGREPSERIRRRRIVEGVPLAVNRTVWYLMAFLMILRIFGLQTGAEIIPVLAAVLVVGLVAGKRALRDAVSGYMISFDNLYAPGDQITVGEVSGIVTELSLRNTRLRTQDGREIPIPNSQVMRVTRAGEKRRRPEPPEGM